MPRHSLTPFFRRVRNFVQNLTPEISFGNDELHIILKRNNWISSIRAFSIIEQKYFFKY